MPVNCQVRVKTISQHSEQTEQRNGHLGDKSAGAVKTFLLVFQAKTLLIMQKNTMQCKARFYWVIMF